MTTPDPHSAKPAPKEQARLSRELRDALSTEVNVSKRGQIPKQGYDVQKCVDLLQQGADPILPREKAYPTSLLSLALKTGNPALIDLIWITGGELSQHENERFKYLGDTLKKYSPKSQGEKVNYAAMSHDERFAMIVAETIPESQAYQRLLALETGDIQVTPETLYKEYGIKFDIDHYRAMVGERTPKTRCEGFSPVTTIHTEESDRELLETAEANRIKYEASRPRR